MSDQDDNNIGDHNAHQAGKGPEKGTNNAPASAAQDRLGELIRNNDRRPVGARYSQIVRSLRIFFPLAALGIMGILIFLSQIEDDFTRHAKDFTLDKPATNELTKPRFESRDSKSQPYTITANKAIQSETQKNKIFLDQPVADITMNDGTWVAIEANQGEYSETQENLMLKGDVKLFQDQGYSLETQEMFLNLNANEATSDVDVYIQGPTGTLNAKGMIAKQNERKITFQGPAKLIIFNDNDTKILP